MGDPKAEDIALWVSSDASNLEYRLLRDVILEVITSYLLGKSSDELSEIAEKVESSVIKELEDIASENVRDGVMPRFDINIDGSTTHIKIRSSPELELIKKLQSDTPEAFEHFCKNILDKLGGRAKVEGGSYDEGIDFTAFDLSFGALSGPAPIGAKVVLVGQAKRYKTGNNVKETELRAFVGAAVKRAYKLKRTHMNQMGSLQPVVYAFWTTADFNKSAKDFAREMGIWYLNGLALAQLATRLKVDDA